MIYLTFPFGYLLLGISPGDLLISTTPATSPSRPATCFLWTHPHLGKRQLCLWNSPITLVRNLEGALSSSIFLMSPFDLLGKSISSFFKAGPELITFHSQLCSYLIQVTFIFCLGVAIIILHDLSSFLLALFSLASTHWTELLRTQFRSCGFCAHNSAGVFHLTEMKSRFLLQTVRLLHLVPCPYLLSVTVSSSLAPPSPHLMLFWPDSCFPALGFLQLFFLHLSAFPPGSHLAYFFSSFWPLLRRHAWNIYCSSWG